MTFYDSAFELARAFGAPIMEPDFWPRDVGSISYGIVGTPKSGHYQVHAARAGAGVLVTGHRESDWQGRSPREWLHAAWREPDELKSLSGWIGWVGTPASLQAFVRSNGLGIQVFGFDTEDQVLAAISSLRLVVPN